MRDERKKQARSMYMYIIAVYCYRDVSTLSKGEVQSLQQQLLDSLEQSRPKLSQMREEIILVFTTPSLMSPRQKSQLQEHVLRRMRRINVKGGVAPAQTRQLGGDISRAQEAASDAEARATRAEQATEQLRRQMQALEQSLESREQEMRRASERAAAAETRTIALQDRLQGLEQELQIASNRATEQQERASNAERQLQQASQRAEAAMSRVRTAENTAIALQDRLEGLEQELQRASNRATEQQERASNAERQLQQASQRAEAAMSRVRTAENTAIALQDRLEGLEQELQRASNRATEQQERASNAERQLQQASQRAEAAMSRVRTAENAVTTLQGQLQNTEQQLEQACQRADEQQQRAADAETRLHHSDQVFQDILQRLIGQIPQSQPHWVVQRNEIRLTAEELGTGGWASVKVALFRGNRVAAKCLHRQIVSAHNVRLFTREMNMAANARHPNLLQFIGATLDSEEPIILTELMPTSLRRVLEEGTRLTRPQIVSVSRHIALALNYLHLMQPEAVIHRDVSSANVLLEPLPGNTWKAKLSDYGSVNFARHTTTAGPGNPTYAAPEANDPQRQSGKMDVFSFGVLLVEVCSGELAPSEHRDRLLASVQWPAMVALIRLCLRHEPQRRPDMSTVITQLDQLRL